MGIRGRENTMRNEGELESRAPAPQILQPLCARFFRRIISHREKSEFNPLITILHLNTFEDSSSGRENDPKHIKLILFKKSKNFLGHPSTSKRQDDL